MKKRETRKEGERGGKRGRERERMCVYVSQGETECFITRR